MKETKLMACGHTANGVLLDKGENIPCCVICYPDPKSYTETEEKPSLEGRIARCRGCKNPTPSKTPSKWDLPFFKYEPDQEQDSYYCGCWGWD